MNLRKPQWTPEEVAVLNQRLLDAEAAVKRMDAELTERDRDRERLTKELEELKRIIADPGAVWINMLRGTIARPRALEHYEECKSALETAKRERDRDTLQETLNNMSDKMVAQSSQLFNAINERDEARCQAAALREALRACLGETPGFEWLFSCPRCGLHGNHATDCIIGKALKSDAGRDFVPRSELEAVQKQAAAFRKDLESCREMIARFLVPWRSRISDSWLSGFEEAGCVVFDAIGFVKPKPIESNAGREFVPLADVEPLLVTLRDVRRFGDSRCAGFASNAIQAWDAKHPEKL